MANLNVHLQRHHLTYFDLSFFIRHLRYNLQNMYLMIHDRTWISWYSRKQWLVFEYNNNTHWCFVLPITSPPRLMARRSRKEVWEFTYWKYLLEYADHTTLQSGFLRTISICHIKALLSQIYPLVIVSMRLVSKGKHCNFPGQLPVSRKQWPLWPRVIHSVSESVRTMASEDGVNAAGSPRWWFQTFYLIYHTTIICSNTNTIVDKKQHISRDL
jgi:hypothetical protein